MKKRAINLTTEAHREAFNDFADSLRAAESREGWRSSETLRNFLDLAFRAVRGRLLLGKAFEENEAEYMRVVKLMRSPKETVTDLARMLGAVGLALIREPVDFLGPVFSELASADEMGQFFTPHHLSYAMAKLIVGDARAMLGDRPYITLAEPACGVGGMVLATNVVLREAGLDVARQAHWHMIDIDYRAMSGAYIQASLTDTSGVVVRGNTLSGETWLSTATPAAVAFPKTFLASTPPVAVTPGEQLSLL